MTRLTEIAGRCPRCKHEDCRDPDSKGCSDNLIVAYKQRIERLGGLLRRAKLNVKCDSPLDVEIDHALAADRQEG